jgi:ABC-2 type transport system permease protein
MSSFLSVARTEFGMSIRRKGPWLAFGVMYAFYLLALFLGGKFQEHASMSTAELWEMNALLAFMFNLFPPVAAGISTADRLVRDGQIKMDELLRSTPLHLGDYLLGKYLGAVAGAVVPALVYILALRVYAIIMGAPAVTFGMSVCTFLLVNLPAYLFVTAFSIICPLVMPTRVYQVLFTGYWFWGNYVYPDMFPSLSGTVLQASGKIPAEGIFGSVIEMGTIRTFVGIDVVWNYLFILLASAAILTAGALYLRRQRALA